MPPININIYLPFSLFKQEKNFLFWQTKTSKAGFVVIPFVFCCQFTREMVIDSQFDKSRIEALPQAGSLFLAAFDIPWSLPDGEQRFTEAHPGKKVSPLKLPSLPLRL